MYSSYNNYYSSVSDDTAIGAVVATILGLGAIFWLIVIALLVLTYVAKWKLFKKANIDGWEALIPVHSDIVELQLGGVKTYWYFLNLVVLRGIGPLIFSFWKSIALSKAFGKGTGFGVLLAFFPYVCYPILAFGSAQYVGPEANNSNNNSVQHVEPETNNSNDNNVEQ